MKKSILLSIICLGVSVFTIKSISLLSQNPDLQVKKYLALVDDQQNKASAVKVVYTCSMHPEIIRDKPGKCPKCGMNLTVKETKKDVYTCPMHSEIIQDKPGKCPKCGMNLALKEPAKKDKPTNK